MSRPRDDARIVKIMEGLDRAGEHDGLDWYACCVTSIGGDGLFANWPHDAVRAVMLSWAVNCPDDALDEMARYAAYKLESYAECCADGGCGQVVAT